MIDLFLDCGAYSAYSKGKIIDIKKYHDFCYEHHKNFNIIASLDDINSWKVSLSNFNKLSKYGNYMPCFHQGEPLDLLEYYIKNNNIIALGGMVGVSHKVLKTWLNSCFKIINNCNTKVHGFGITDQSLMSIYPWYSVDSSTWLRVSRMGMILIPRKRYGKYRYDIPPRRIQVSDNGPHKNDQFSHINIMSNIERNHVLDIINNRGFTIGKSLIDEKSNEKIIIEKGLSNNFFMRDKFNYEYMLNLSSALNLKIYLSGSDVKEEELISISERCKMPYERYFELNKYKGEEEWKEKNF